MLLQGVEDGAALGAASSTRLVEVTQGVIAGLAWPPLQVGPIHGLLGLNLPLIELGSNTPAQAADEITTWLFPLGYDAGLVGLAVPIQALVIQPITGVRMFTNTALIRL